MTLADEARSVDPKAALGKLAELLERNGISVDDVGRVSKVNLWQGFHKNEDGDAEVVDLAGITFAPAWAEGPKWPVIQPARPVLAEPRPAPKTSPGVETIFIAPDPQIGCRRYEDGRIRIPRHHVNFFATQLVHDVLDAYAPHAHA